MFQFLIKDKFALTRLTSFLAFVFTMFMVPNLWSINRGFPAVPYLNLFKNQSSFINIFLIVSFIFLYAWFVVKPNWKIATGVVLLYVFFALSDQNKIQPYFFEMMFVVLALSVFKDNSKYLEKCLIIVFIGTYFWSGIHKINEHFFELWLNGLNKRIPFIPYSLRVAFTYAVPFIEAFLGLSLLFVKTRKIGAVLLVIMHILILTTLFMAGYGYVLLPLTAFNAFVLLTVIYNSKLLLKDFVTINSKKYALLIVLVIVMPFGNLLGITDHWLSFSYYSGKPKNCRLYFVNKKQSEELPSHIKKYVQEYHNTYYIELNTWSGYELGVGVYPEKRVYQKVKRYVDAYLLMPSERLEYY